MTVPNGKKLINDSMNVTQSLIDTLGDRIDSIHSITLDGYGSSRTAALVSATFVEKVTGLPVNLIIPNNICRKIAVDPGSLYVFISESGRSELLEKDIDLVREKGGFVLLVTANEDSPLAKKVDSVICTGCEKEEYFFHTVGHCCSTISLMCMGMRLGLERKVITEDEYHAYCEKANEALDHHPKIVEEARVWAKKHIDALISARCVVLFGSGPLYGIAEEGALKIQEITEKTPAKGYEIYQKIYGSTTCFGKDDVVIVLDDGIHETETGKGIVDFMNYHYNNGYLISPDAKGEKDFRIVPAGGDFRVLEYVPIVEIIAYEMAVAQGHPILDIDHYDSDFFEKFLKAKE